MSAHTFLSDSLTFLSRVFATGIAAIFVAACGNSGAGAPSEGAAIGLLLPFTGSSVGTTNNFERAALLAEERVARGGGVNGRPLRIVSADTHSDTMRAQRSAESLVNAGVSVVVGAESAEISAELRPYLAAQGVTFLSPLVGAANNAEVDCSTPWFRLAPSAQDLGEALAKQISAAGIKVISVMSARTAYDKALSDSVVSRFTQLKGSVRLSVDVDPDGQSYESEINLVRDADADAVVLATSPKTGALIASEFYLLSSAPPVWFLSPLLKTDLLLQNAVPGALEGARGVAPKIYEDGSGFPKAFANRWRGDQPLEGANFYYDAVALLAFAFNTMTPNADGSYDAAALDKALRRASAPPGSSAGWDEIESGLERQRDGSPIYYSGLTGPLTFRSCGERAYGASTTWHVHSGKIITDD